ncbi:MAG: hypothetical protein R3C11_26245 [Planctomycetaceae bacterium]
MGQTIVFKCPECRQRCEAEVKAESFKIRCQGCNSPIRVPASSELEKKRAKSKANSQNTSSKERARSSTSVEYTAEGRRIRQRSTSGSGSGRRKVPASRSNHPVPVLCPGCKTNFSSTESEYGKTIQCPLCNHSIDLPDPYASQRERKSRRGNNVSHLIDGEIAPAPRERRERMPKGLMLYIQGVLGFPFQSEVIFRLVIFAMLIFFMDACIDAFVFALKTIPIFAFRTFGLSAVIMVFLVGSHAAVTFQTIFEETAAGSREVKGWIEFDKHEYFYRLMHIGWLLVIAAALGFTPVIITNIVLNNSGISLPAGLHPMLLLFPAGCLFTLAAFPFVALSTFEQHSLYAIFSPVVFKSLFREWWGWGIVILVTWMFFLPWIILRMFGAFLFPIANLVILSPYFAYIFFVYSRLLGRLGYKIAQSADWD